MVESDESIWKEALLGVQPLTDKERVFRVAKPKKLARHSGDEAAASEVLPKKAANGVDKIQDDTFSIFADKGKVFTVTPANRYFRIVYTNGSTAQTSFSLQTRLVLAEALKNQYLNMI